MLPGYRYKPLSSSRPEIRLVTLLPGSWNDGICCTLRHVYLDNDPFYEALSYMWGDANDTRPIRLDGRPIQITKNLEIALHYLRPQQGQSTRVVWVDALCINQNDLRERSQQVVRMRRIFTSATRVLAWTGEPDEDSDAALDLMDDMARIGSWEESHSITTLFSVERLQFENGSLLDVTRRNWQSLFRFLDRKYWTRVWVVQELTPAEKREYSREPTKFAFLCGLRSFSRWALYVVSLFWLRVIAQHGGIFREIPAFRDVPSAIRMYATTMPTTSDSGLWTRSFIVLIRDAGELGASDPRDRVYAMLGLVEFKKTSLRPDYTKPVEQVYMDLVKCCVKEYGNCNIFAGNMIRRDHNGPSWSCTSAFPLVVTSFRDQHPAGDTPVCIEFHDQDRLMTAGGTHVGKIRRVVGPFFDVTSVSEEAALLEALGDVRTWRQNPQMAFLLQTVQDLDEAQKEVFCKCISMVTRAYQSNPAPLPDKDVDLLRSTEGLPPKYSRGEDDGVLLTHAGDSVINRFSLLWCLSRRCFFMTECGKMGIGPYDTQIGDSAVILYGGNSCFILRPTGIRYTLQGDAYVHGIMDGELVKDLGEDGKPKNSQTFVIC